MLSERLSRAGPKRILALDGGGTRGVVSLAFLLEVERSLCGEDPDGSLADHFDLIGGTSTGAIIAAGLALGWRVADIVAMYMHFAEQVFRPRWQRWLLLNWYRAQPLEHLLRLCLQPPGTPEGVPDVLMGDPALRTGLAIVTKRVDTGSVWVISNLPGAPHFVDRRGQPNGNWRIPLRDIVRASAAAPMFFEPAEFELGPRIGGGAHRGRFVDGGVSPFNNPALRMLELARLPSFGLCWPTGRERLMIVSIGTGRYRLREPVLPRFDERPLAWLGRLPSRLPLVQAIFALRGTITDGEMHTLRLLHALGSSPAPAYLDGEVGRMAEGGLAGAPLFTLLRYDLDFDAMASAGTITGTEARRFQSFDAPEEMPRLFALATEAARRDVVAAHLRFPAPGMSEAPVSRPPAP
ncbi:patatin-like phospholipase family protein [Roseomonas sp. HF4]|uniref:patatin-like phospholipase family protein n=1 Tax=Roseomonas sp. HF4 TaxID=2562313 RepID=UPI0010C01BFE|nr:patatin-like phospholipase family protein [Roseomonas sp. HF4]